MKKTIFLFCLIIFTIPFNNVRGVFNDRTFEFDDFNLVLDNYYIDGSRGVAIEKTGVNPFYTTIYFAGESFIINGILKTDENFILYGSNHIIGNETYYDALFIVIDYEGNLINKTTVDYGDLEEVKGAYFIDGILIIHSKKSTDDGIDFVFENNYFSAYGPEYQLLDTIEIGTEIYKLEANDKYILFTYENDNIFDGAIRSDLSLLLPSDRIEIENNQIFIDEVHVEFLNDAFLNGELVQNGVVINYPGNYLLNYKLAEYNFVLKPIVSGFEDNQIYNNAVTPYISSGNIILNNDIFISETMISKPGNYELSITGINDYLETYNFTITSDMKGIINNQTYNDTVEISFNGEGYLNNQFVTSPVLVPEEGEYILKINGENNYLETYYFQIEKDDESVTIVDFVQKFDIVILVVALLTGGIILKKK